MSLTGFIRIAETICVSINKVGLQLYLFRVKHPLLGICIYFSQGIFQGLGELPGKSGDLLQVSNRVSEALKPAKLVEVM